MEGTDLRKSNDGLAVLVSQAFALDSFGPSLFVFCNRKRDKLKILYWENNGFWLYYRRLERGRFQWSEATSKSSVVVTRRQLQWLLDGLAPEQQQAHSAVTARIII